MTAAEASRRTLETDDTVRRPIPVDGPARRRGVRTCSRTVRLSNLCGVAAGSAVSLAWTTVLPSVLVGIAASIALLLSGRRHFQFQPSVLDDVPGAAVSVWSGTMVAVSALLLADASPEAAAALGVGLAVFVGVVLFRYLAYSILRPARRRRRGLASAVIVGSGEAARELAFNVTNETRFGVHLIGCVSDEESLPPHQAPWLGPVASLPTLIEEHHVELVLVSNQSESEEPDIVASLRAARRARCEVYVVPRLLLLHERPRHVSLVGSIPLARLRRSAFRDPSWVLKRCFDVVCSTLALVALLPVLLVLALAVRLEVGRGIIFRQERVGLNGRPFTLYKFRSLRPAVGEGDIRWSIEGDPRLGPVGTFIRASSLDELPQLINVLRGDMSLVGPRPERPYFVEQFSRSVAGYEQRHGVPVGLTGYAAVNGLRGDTSIADRAQFDNMYGDSWSLWLDIKIVIRTAFQLFRRSGPRSR